MTTLLDRPTVVTSPASPAAPVSPAALASPAAPARFAPVTALLRLEAQVLAVLRVVALPALRVALGLVYLVFGGLKVVGLTPVGDLVSSMVPFVPADVAVVGMGVVEVAVGAALIAGVLVPWIAAGAVAHLLGTFLVFLVHPDVAFTGGNPLALTLEGEFIAKNVVLIAGLLVVAAFSAPRRKH